MYLMQDYDNALKTILERGVSRTNKRTGERTRTIFGMQCRYRIDEHFPIVTRRKVWPKSIFAELLWIISGSTNNHDLQNLGSNIWSPWVDRKFEAEHGFAHGCLGPVYGFQLRYFGGNYGNGIGGEAGTSNTVGPDGKSLYGQGGFDQLAWLVSRIKEDSSCRRTLFDLWDPKTMSKQRLMPCHYSFQVMVDDEGRMSGMLSQRSNDFPVGVPANIHFYSALLYMLAQQTGHTPYEFIHSAADSHIYENQIPAVEEYLARQEVPDSPKLQLRQATDLFSYQMEDFNLVNYQPLSRIEIPVAV